MEILRSGEFKKYPFKSRTGPHNLIVDDNGIVWYAGNLAAHIGKLDPETGTIVHYPMPDERAVDPHTLVFGEPGVIWFSVQRGNFVGRIDLDTGEVNLIEVPTKNARPYGIIVAPNGSPWFAEFGSNKLGRVDRESMSVVEYELPRDGARPRRLEATSDGMIWYVDYADGYLGRLDPQTKEIEEWLLPSGAASRPYGMVVDDKDRLWFVETGPDPNRFVGFDPDTEKFFHTTAIESGGGAVRHMMYEAATQTVWFGTDENTVGRAVLP